MRIVVVRGDPVRCAGRKGTAAGKRNANPRSRAVRARIRVGGVAKPARCFRRSRWRRDQAAIDFRALSDGAGRLEEAAGAYRVSIRVAARHRIGRVDVIGCIRPGRRVGIGAQIGVEGIRG